MNDAVDQGARPAVGRTRFVVYTLPRTGSYHLTSLLASAPDIVCHGEVFKANTVELPRWHKRQLGLDVERGADNRPVRDADPVAFLDALSALTPRRHFGFKLFADHVRDRPSLNHAVLEAKAWRKVFLLRNPLESYASYLRARETGVWTLRGETPRAVDRDVLDKRVVFAAAGFDRYMEEIVAFRRRVAELTRLAGNPCHAIGYHQVGDHEAVGALLRFIGSRATPETLKSEMHRQFSGRLEDAFSNWPEVRDALAARGLTALADGAPTMDELLAIG